MERPVYRSYAESFRLNIYLPESGLIAPPTVTCRADEWLSARMDGDRPPQSVLIDLTGTERTDALERAMQMIRGRAVPIIRFDTVETGRAAAAFLMENHIGDATLCTPYENRRALAQIRRMLPLSRGMLDLRECEAPEPVELVGQCQMNEATMVLTDGNIDREWVRRLQKRFIHVWAEDHGDLPQAVLSGACGVLTQRVEEAYDLFKRFPAGSTQRPAPLYAHKTYHVTGEYPENSVKGCAAAGRRGYDAAEIDVQLTKDDVMVVHHDRNTNKLFTENRVVCETGWDELKTLRRRGFSEDGLDRMDELMKEMSAYPETPVLIEIKTPADTFGVEEMVRQLKELLKRGDVQKGCTLIMGVMPPYLSYVHEQIPYLPAAHCTCVKAEQATDDVDENNLRLYRFAMETRGANAGFNPYHPTVGRTFARLAHVRGITVFTWTWAFEAWEDGGAAITDSFLQGHDGLTSDWIGKFDRVPLDVRATAPEPDAECGEKETAAEVLMRGEGWKECRDVEIVPLDEGSCAGQGERRFAVGAWTELDGGRRVCVIGSGIKGGR